MEKGSRKIKKMNVTEKEMLNLFPGKPSPLPECETKNVVVLCRNDWMDVSGRKSYFYLINESK